MEKLFVNIRKAEPADIGGIASIYEQAVLLGTASFEVTPPSEEEMLSRMQTIEAGHYPYLVAELEHQILGFALRRSVPPEKGLSLHGGRLNLCSSGMPQVRRRHAASDLAHC